ncbi:DUF1642 domain-containing protein [Enterococcus gallinarum]|uniref:DUF1642 domain-containing protein n=1 Tax=Enterococcus gallinarum TaxID=1353 RepID=UPI00164E4CEB|nr:DUF1642 domain-containing protein [Enterococcus gallinarum]
MNKQEIIRNIDLQTYAYPDKPPEGNYGPTIAYKKGFNSCAEWAINLIEQLDEQPKVTVPKFVATWINQCKEKATLADCLDGYYEISNGEVVSSEDFQNWVVDNENDELTAKAWMFGYEVEKEPLYQIELPGTSWGAYLTKADNGDLVIFQNTTSGSAFTESEIKAIDERYWAFAVPVEEDK